MSEKKFCFSPEKLMPLVKDGGYCYATDEITVGGRPVGYMYREPPMDDGDSGWRFYAGDESDAYVDDEANHGEFDLNTIANCDQDTLLMLDAPVGAAFARNPQSGEFEPTESPVEPDECLHPDYPIVEGDHALSDVWHVTLPAKFNRTIEEDALVLWRPDMSLYFVAWNNDHQDPMEERLVLLKSDLNPDAFDPQEELSEDKQTFSYRLLEDGVNMLYGFVVTERGHLQVAISFEDEAALDTVRATFASIG